MFQQWPYDKPTPPGYTQYAVYEDFYWIIVPDDEYDPAVIDWMLVELRRILRRAWRAARRKQIGMRVIDGGVA